MIRVSHSLFYIYTYIYTLKNHAPVKLIWNTVSYIIYPQYIYIYIFVLLQSTLLYMYVKVNSVTSLFFVCKLSVSAVVCTCIRSFVQNNNPSSAHKGYHECAFCNYRTWNKSLDEEINFWGDFKSIFVAWSKGKKARVRGNGSSNYLSTARKRRQYLCSEYL